MSELDLSERVLDHCQRVQQLREKISDCNPLIRSNALVQEAESVAKDSLELFGQLCILIGELKTQGASNDASNQ